MWDFLMKLQSYFLWMLLGAVLLVVCTIFVAAITLKAKDVKDGDKGDDDETT